MQNANDLNNWYKGDGFRASHLNEVVDFLQERGDVVAGPGIRVQSGSKGTIISLAPQSFTGRWFIGKITASGPNGEADNTNQLYWVINQYMNPTGDITVVPDLRDELSLFGEPLDPEADPDGEPITQYNNVALAVNVAECKEQTHNLAYGQYVYVWETRELGSFDDGSTDSSADKTPMFRWVFFSPDPGRGQYAGMAFVTQTQNNRGWVFPFCHAALS